MQKRTKQNANIFTLGLLISPYLLIVGISTFSVIADAQSSSNIVNKRMSQFQLDNYRTERGDASALHKATKYTFRLPDFMAKDAGGNSVNTTERKCGVIAAKFKAYEAGGTLIGDKYISCHPSVSDTNNNFSQSLITDHDKFQQMLCGSCVAVTSADSDADIGGWKFEVELGEGIIKSINPNFSNSFFNYDPALLDVTTDAASYIGNNGNFVDVEFYVVLTTDLVSSMAPTNYTNTNSAGYFKDVILGKEQTSSTSALMNCKIKARLTAISLDITEVKCKDADKKFIVTQVSEFKDAMGPSGIVSGAPIFSPDLNLNLIQAHF